MTGKEKATAYNPLPPLELGAETDRRSLWLSCNSLQAVLVRLHNLQATAPTALPAAAFNAASCAALETGAHLAGNIA